MLGQTCGDMGKQQGDLRLYTSEECDALNGIYHESGECTKKDGGSFSYDCGMLYKEKNAMVQRNATNANIRNNSTLKNVTNARNNSTAKNVTNARNNSTAKNVRNARNNSSATNIKNNSTVKNVRNVKNNSSATNAKNNTSATNAKNNSSATNAKNNSSATNAKNNSSATNAKNNTSATNAKNRGWVGLAKNNSSATNVKNNSSAKNVALPSGWKQYTNPETGERFGYHSIDGRWQMEPPSALNAINISGLLTASAARGKVPKVPLKMGIKQPQGLKEYYPDQPQGLKEYYPDQPDVSGEYVPVYAVKDINAKFDNINYSLGIFKDMINKINEGGVPVITQKVIESGSFATAEDTKRLTEDINAKFDNVNHSLRTLKDMIYKINEGEVPVITQKVIESGSFATAEDTKRLTEDIKGLNDAIEVLKGSIANIQIPDTSKLALASDLQALKGAISNIQIPDTSKLALASDLQALKGAISNIQIPDTSKLALASDVTAIKDTIKELKDAQAKIVLPNTSNFALDSDLEKIKESVSKIDIPNTSQFVKLSDINKRVAPAINKSLAPINDTIEKINNSINELEERIPQENIPEENISQEGGRGRRNTRRSRYRLRKTNHRLKKM